MLDRNGDFEGGREKKASGEVARFVDFGLGGELGDFCKFM